MLPNKETRALARNLLLAQMQEKLKERYRHLLIDEPEPICLPDDEPDD